MVLNYVLTNVLTFFVSDIANVAVLSLQSFYKNKNINDFILDLNIYL